MASVLEKLGVSFVGVAESRVPFALGKKVSVLFRGDKHSAIAFEKALVERVETAGFHGFEGATEWLVSESLDKMLLDA